MKITAPEHASVFHIAQNLREIDRVEIFAIRNHDNPFMLTNEVMTRPEMSWVLWHDDVPAVLLGGVEMWRGVWSIHCFGTNDWHKLAIPLTRFVKKVMLPLLFNKFDAHRLEADSIANHSQAHRWMEMCGARREGVKAKRGRGGEDYFTYVIVKDVDWPRLDKSDTAC